MKFLFASPETHYVRQRGPQRYPTARFPRSGTATVPQTAPDQSVGDMSFTGKDGVVPTVVAWTVVAWTGPPGRGPKRKR